MGLSDGKAIDEEKDHDGLQPLSLGEPPEKKELVADDDVEIIIEEDEGDPERKSKDVLDEDEDEPDPKKGAASDEDDTSGVDAGEDTEDEEFKSFKPAVQKRIQREIRIRRRAEEAANLAVGKVREVETRYTEVNTEAETLRGANHELQKNYAQVLAAAFADRIEVKQFALKTARDAGDFEKEQAVIAEIDDLRFKQNQVKEMASRLETSAPPKKEEKKEEQQQQQQPVPPLVKKWLAANAWYTNPKFVAQRRSVEVIDAQVKADGYDPATSEYFAEMDRRVDKMFPTLRRKKDGGTPAPKIPVAGMGDQGGTRKAPKGQIVLKKSDLEAMRKFNLDPTNKVHLREYARNIKASSGEAS